MALTKVGPKEYIALSSDISTNKITGASIIGGTVYMQDTGVTYVINSDLTLGLYAQPVNLGPDLKIGAKSLALTLSTGAGSTAIPDTARLIGVKPVSSTSIRVGLEAPEADGAKTGDAVAADFKKGIPVDAAVWTWFLVGIGASRTLYVKGGTSDVVEVCYM